MEGDCRICGQRANGTKFVEWVRPTFTNFDALVDGDIICDACLFWFDESSEELAKMAGKDKPQRMRNYSHFIKNGEWTPLGKGDKKQMKLMLLDYPFPELAVIADSGQKHIVFRARRNPPGGVAGFVQFEENTLYIVPDRLAHFLCIIEELYQTFSKDEIETGRYAQYRIAQFGLERWMELEDKIRNERGSLFLKLCVFLAQKGEEDGNRTKVSGSGFAPGDMEGDSGGLQTPVSLERLETIRGASTQCILPDEQSGEVCQPRLL